MVGGLVHCISAPLVSYPFYLLVRRFPILKITQFLHRTLHLSIMSLRASHLLRVLRIAPRGVVASRTTISLLPASRFIQPLWAPRLFGTTTVPYKKKGRGAEKHQPAEEADIEAQLDLDVTGKNMKQVVSKCRETVQGLIGSLGRVDASALGALSELTSSAAGLCARHLWQGCETDTATRLCLCGCAGQCFDYHRVRRQCMCFLVSTDSQALKHIERGIYAAQLDLSPRIAPEEGEGVIVVQVPKPTGETRKQLALRCTKECDHAKMMLRNERHTAQKQLKHDLDHKVVDKNASQKDSKKVCGTETVHNAYIQLEDLTKQHTAQIDAILTDAHKRLLH